MNRIKKMLESELNCFEYNIDIESIKRSEAHLRKRRKKVLLSITSFIFVIIVVSAVLIIPNSKNKENTANNNSTHSFFIVASALDAETNEPLVKLTDSKSIPQKDIIIMQIRFTCTYYVHGVPELEGSYEMGDKRLDEIFANDNLTINKSFTRMGDNSIWIEGGRRY